VNKFLLTRLLLCIWRFVFSDVEIVGHNFPLVYAQLKNNCSIAVSQKHALANLNCAMNQCNSSLYYR